MNPRAPSYKLEDLGVSLKTRGVNAFTSSAIGAGVNSGLKLSRRAEQAHPAWEGAPAASACRRSLLDHLVGADEQRERHVKAAEVS
jgi:hypothetical protein